MVDQAQSIDEAMWVVIDVETTGMDPRLGDRICELAAIKLQDGQILDRFHTFLNPQCPVSFGAFQINQITQDLLEAAPLIEQVLPKFLEFVKGGILVAYNAEFDFKFLQHALQHHGYDASELIVLDALTLAKRLFPTLKKYALWQVARHLSLSYSQLHRALEDADLTTQVLLECFRLLKARGLPTVADALAFTKTTPTLL